MSEKSECKEPTRNIDAIDTADISRRDFIAKAAVTGAAFTILPRHVLGRGFVPPSDTLNIACVGVGGMGRSNLINLASQNIVALCDVDWGYTDKNLSRLDTDASNLQNHIDHPDATPGAAQAVSAADAERAKARLANILHLKNDLIPKAKRYSDYRKMFDQQKDIDAVVVATPDHMHCSIALAAMDLNKHVYVQKPLCWSVDECRKLSKRAQETKLATQMGNQGRSLNDTKTAVELIQCGAIGEVREVHVWTDRPVGFWPQGIPRPLAAIEPLDSLKWDLAGVNARLAAAMAAGNYPVPETLSWDLFLGVGPSIKYHPVYHPFNWRGWVDWGVGAIGDMGAHLLDVSMTSLNLGFPTSVEAVSSPFNGACYPTAEIIFYEFPARGSMPPVKLTWFDGGLTPPKPVELGEEELKKEGGAIIIGSKGKLIHDTYGANPRLLPKSLQESTPKPAQKLPRIENEAHELNWVAAAKGHGQTASPFEYAAQLTEVMVLGVVSLKAGKKIAYDGANMRVTNVPEANQYLSRTYRQGW
jgi:predicted dehydrogenase